MKFKIADDMTDVEPEVNLWLSYHVEDKSVYVRANDHFLLKINTDGTFERCYGVPESLGFQTTDGGKLWEKPK